MAKATGMLAASIGAAAKNMGSRSNSNRATSQKPPKPQKNTTQTSSIVTTGPMPSAGQRGYVANLLPDAVANYDTRFPAGVVYTAGKPMDQAQADYLNDYISGRISDSMSFGNWRSSGGYRGGATAATPGGSDPATQAPTKSYKDIKSIAGGLRIGGDNILGKREAGRIARNTGKSYDDVITKALGRGMSIGGGAVRKSNRASGTSLLTPTIKGQQMFTSGGLDDPLSQMRRVNPGRRQMYSGTYELDGKTMPLVESRRGGVNPMSIGGGKGKRGNKGRNKGDGMTDSEITSPTNNAAPQTMDYTPMTPEQMKDASTVEGPGMMAGGGAGVGGATKLGRAKSRLRQLGIYGRGTNLLGRGLQYGNVLNA